MRGKPIRSRASVVAGALALCALGALLALGAVVSVGVPSALAADPAPTVEARVIDALAAGMTPEQRAELRFLEHLGWRFVRDPSVAAVTVWGGTPCYRRDLASAHAGGDLVIKIPATLAPADAAAFAASLSGIADSIASRCAYLHKIQVSTGRMTTRLAEMEKAGTFVFPQLIFWNSPFFKFRGPPPEWQKDEWCGRALAPPAAAMAALLERGGVAECYSAQQVAVWAIQYDLFGPEAFDEAFVREDLVIGRPTEVQASGMGRTSRDNDPWPWRALLLAGADQQKDAGLALAGYGPKAFAGLTGCIRDLAGTDESNENFTIVAVSPAVVEQLKAKGGLPYMADQCKVAFERWKAEKKGSASPTGPTYDAIMSQPVFTEMIVYCQPFGVGPIRKVIEKEMIEEENGPIWVLMYLHGREDEYYRRYRKVWKDRWLRAQPPPR